MPGGGGGCGGSGAYWKSRGGAWGEGGGEGGTSEYLCRKAPLTKTRPGAFSSTFWMTPQLAALSLQNCVSMAVMPDRTRMRAAKVAKESPPRKTGTLKVYERTVQSAAACASKPSPRTNRLSSVLLTMVAKSCLYSAPSEPPHRFRHLILSFLHHTLSSPHALNR